MIATSVCHPLRDGGLFRGCHPSDRGVAAIDGPQHWIHWTSANVPQQTYLSNGSQQCTSAMDQVASLATEHLAARIAHKFDKRVHAARRVAVSHIKKWKQKPVVHAVLLLK